MRRSAAALLVAAAAWATPVAAEDPAPPATASVEIVNQTRWWIYELYLAPADAIEWGEDQLGDESIGPGDHFTLHEIPCRSWDVLIVDEDGDECVVLDLELCRDDYTWVIENDDLLACQRRSERSDR